MRAVILAAGKGSRISRYLSGKPKCTVDIGGKTLIEYTVSLLKAKGIQDIAIVVGYNAKEIEKVTNGYDVAFFENPFFDVTNSIASLWFARGFLDADDDYIIMNGDVFVEERLLDEILNEELSPVMFADSTRKECADYKFNYEKGILKKYGKELGLEETSGEYIGIAKFDSVFKTVFLKKLQYMVFSQKHNVWWENVIYDMVGERDICVHEISGLFWAEVDYVEDYERILQFRDYRLEYSLKVQNVSKLTARKG